MVGQLKQMGLTQSVVLMHDEQALHGCNAGSGHRMLEMWKLGSRTWQGWQEKEQRGVSGGCIPIISIL